MEGLGDDDDGVFADDFPNDKLILKITALIDTLTRKATYLPFDEARGLALLGAAYTDRSNTDIGALDSPFFTTKVYEAEPKTPMSHPSVSRLRAMLAPQISNLHLCPIPEITQMMELNAYAVRPGLGPALLPAVWRMEGDPDDIAAYRTHGLETLEAWIARRKTDVRFEQKVFVIAHHLVLQVHLLRDKELELEDDDALSNLLIREMDDDTFIQVETTLEKAKKRYILCRISCAVLPQIRTCARTRLIDETKDDTSVLLGRFADRVEELWGHRLPFGNALRNTSVGNLVALLGLGVARSALRRADGSLVDVLRGALAAAENALHMEPEQQASVSFDVGQTDVDREGQHGVAARASLPGQDVRCRRCLHVLSPHPVPSAECVTEITSLWTRMNGAVAEARSGKIGAMVTSLVEAVTKFKAFLDSVHGGLREKTYWQLGGWVLTLAFRIIVYVLFGSVLRVRGFGTRWRSLHRFLLTAGAIYTVGVAPYPSNPREIYDFNTMDTWFTKGYIWMICTVANSLSLMALLFTPVVKFLLMVLNVVFVRHFTQRTPYGVIRTLLGPLAEMAARRYIATARDAAEMAAERDRVLRDRVIIRQENTELWNSGAAGKLKYLWRQLATFAYFVWSYTPTLPTIGNVLTGLPPGVYIIVGIAIYFFTMYLLGSSGVPAWVVDSLRYAGRFIVLCLQWILDTASPWMDRAYGKVVTYPGIAPSPFPSGVSQNVTLPGGEIRPLTPELVSMICALENGRVECTVPAFAMQAIKDAYEGIKSALKRIEPPETYVDSVAPMMMSVAVMDGWLKQIVSFVDKTVYEDAINDAFLTDFDAVMESYGDEALAQITAPQFENTCMLLRGRDRFVSVEEMRRRLESKTETITWTVNSENYLMIDGAFFTHIKDGIINPVPFENWRLYDDVLKRVIPPEEMSRMRTQATFGEAYKPKEKDVWTDHVRRIVIVGATRFIAGQIGGYLITAHTTQKALHYALCQVVDDGFGCDRMGSFTEAVRPTNIVESMVRVSSEVIDFLRDRMTSAFSAITSAVAWCARKLVKWLYYILHSDILAAILTPSRWAEIMRAVAGSTIEKSRLIKNWTKGMTEGFIQKLVERINKPKEIKVSEEEFAHGMNDDLQTLFEEEITKINDGVPPPPDKVHEIFKDRSGGSFAGHLNKLLSASFKYVSEWRSVKNIAESSKMDIPDLPAQAGPEDEARSLAFKMSGTLRVVTAMLGDEPKLDELPAFVEPTGRGVIAAEIRQDVLTLISNFFATRNIMLATTSPELHAWDHVHKTVDKIEAHGVSRSVIMSTLVGLLRQLHRRRREALADILRLWVTSKDVADGSIIPARLWDSVSERGAEVRKLFGLDANDSLTDYVGLASDIDASAPALPIAPSEEIATPTMQTLITQIISAGIQQQSDARWVMKNMKDPPPELETIPGDLLDMVTTAVFVRKCAGTFFDSPSSLRDVAGSLHQETLRIWLDSFGGVTSWISAKIWGSDKPDPRGALQKLLDEMYREITKPLIVYLSLVRREAMRTPAILESSVDEGLYTAGYTFLNSRTRKDLVRRYAQVIDQWDKTNTIPVVEELSVEAVGAAGSADTPTVVPTPEQIAAGRAAGAGAGAPPTDQAPPSRPSLDEL